MEGPPSQHAADGKPQLGSPETLISSHFLCLLFSSPSNEQLPSLSEDNDENGSKLKNFLGPTQPQDEERS